MSSCWMCCSVECKSEGSVREKDLLLFLLVS